MNLIKFASLGLMPLCLFTASLESGAATFGDDVAFLKKHAAVVVLSDHPQKAEIVVSPAWRGRVLTSTAQGDDGASFGWINDELIPSCKLEIPLLCLTTKTVKFIHVN